jgi:hypothetical protein
MVAFPFADQTLAGRIARIMTVLPSRTAHSGPRRKLVPTSVRGGDRPADGAEADAELIARHVREIVASRSIAQT